MDIIVGKALGCQALMAMLGQHGALLTNVASIEVLALLLRESNEPLTTLMLNSLVHPMGNTQRCSARALGIAEHVELRHINALGKTDYQVIISMGTNTDHFDAVPENIEIYESVDQMAVLSIADAFLTHCGMNSASEGLYFQVPLVLFPQTPEQGAVAKRTEELGAGIMLKSISEEDILQALNTVLTVPSYKENAVLVSDSFRACGGAKEARAFLEEIAGKS